MNRVYSVDEVEAMHGRGLIFMGEDLKRYTYLSPGPYGTFYFSCEGHTVLVDAELRRPGNQLLPVIGFSTVPTQVQLGAIRIEQVRDEFKLDPLWALFVNDAQVGGLYSNRELVEQLIKLGVRAVIKSALIRMMNTARGQEGVK